MGGGDADKGGQIVVDGATGYLGTHLTYKLLSEGFSVACVVHPGAKRSDAEQLRKMGAEVYIGNFNQDDEASPVLARAFQNAVAAVHLIGSVAPKKGQKLVEMHAGQTHWFLQHAQKGNTGRIVMVTTLGTSSDAATIYQRTKWAAEQIIAAGPLPYTILRPSLLVGCTVGTRDSKLVKRYREILAKKAIVPVIGGGHNKIQPVFVQDVVSAICRCIFPGKWQREATGKELEIGGPEVLEMRKFVKLLMEATGKNKPLVGVPAPLAFMSAMFCEAYQEVPSVSADQVKLSLRDNVCTDNALTAVLGIEPTPLKTALATYADIERGAIATGAKG